MKVIFKDMMTGKEKEMVEGADYFINETKPETELDRYKKALDVAMEFIQYHANHIEYNRENYIRKLREINQILGKEEGKNENERK